MANDSIASEVIAALALLGLGYQIWSTNRRFDTLNKGLLNALPRLDLARKDVVAIQHFRAGGEQMVGANFQVEALNPVVIFQNVGNLPLKYHVEKFDVWVNGTLRTPPLQRSDKTLGVLFPKCETDFRIAGIPLSDRGEAMPFETVMALALKLHIKIRYGTGKNMSSVVDRIYEFRHLANAGDLLLQEINDRW